MSSDDVEVIVDFSVLEGLPARLNEAGGRAFRHAALDLLSIAAGGNQAQHPGAPVDEGTLRGSGSAHFGGERIAVSDAPTTGDAEPTPLEGGAETDAMTAAVAFNTVYAAYQHERTDLPHPKGGAAKYLQEPLERNADFYVQQIADAVGRELT